MTMDMNWIAIGDINDIPLRGARCVKTPQGKIAVFRTADPQRGEGGPQGRMRGAEGHL